MPNRHVSQMRARAVTGMFEIDTRSGLLKGVRLVASPNCDTRPAESSIDVLVIHAISLPAGQFGGLAIEQLFCNCLDPNEHPTFREIHELEVSAHLLIRRDGEIVQFVPFHLRAWHAGQSICEGRARVNDFSVGIELEGTDDVPFEVAQYEVLTKITRALMAAYPAITRERIYGHCHIAAGRKTDPGPLFDWKRYLEAL